MKKLDIPSEIAILVENWPNEDIDGMQEWAVKAKAAGIGRDGILKTLVGSGWPAPFVTWYLDGAAPPTAKPASTKMSEPTHASLKKRSPKGGVDTVEVPAGEFRMGSKDCQDGKLPPKVHLDAYHIGLTPVTVSQFKAYCQDKGIDFSQFPKPDWGWLDDHPMVNVTWHEAREFCKWVGGDLPTEAQWEKAARGMDARMFPWGNQFDFQRLRCSKGVPGDVRTTASAGSFPLGASPYGCLDMAGNVWEWCLDRYTPAKSGQVRRIVPGPESGQGCVLRGGSWIENDPAYLRTVVRINNDPNHRYINMGFRLACTA